MCGTFEALVAGLVPPPAEGAAPEPAALQARPVRADPAMRGGGG